MNYIFLLTGLFAGFVIAWLIRSLRSPEKESALQLSRLKEDLGASQNEMSAIKAANLIFREENESFKTLAKQKQEELMRVNMDFVATKSNLQNTEEKMQVLKSEMIDLRNQFTKEFENLANRIFDEKGKKFAEQNKTNLDDILKPFSEKIRDFEKKVNEVYVTEGKERAALKEQINLLHTLNQQMSLDARNLTKALKGETKTQGNWGELILETILEKSGLVKNREYEIQASLTGEDGRRLQPDVIIHLPEGKQLIIDSKVSLTGYERYSSADNDEDRQSALRDHIISVRKHIKELGEKSYQSLYQLKTLDFVLLFIPIEPAFALAVQEDLGLFNDAFEKNIVIVSPSTMLATLRTVSSIWRQENQNRNALEIARQGGALYDKFVGFVDDLIGLGNKMRDAQKNYESAMAKLSSGSGNLVKRTEELRKLGAKATKNLPASLLERSDDELV